MELLDFNSRDNFDFLRIAPAYKIPEHQQAKLRKNCELVVHSAQKSVLELCRLGLYLKEIKEDDTWRFVYNEKSGTTFQYQKFTDFTSYVFGLSPTMVENLMNVSQFAMITDDGNDDVVFINEKYERYKYSQLIEMGSMQSWHRAEITPEMTVSEIRLCKAYIKSGDYLLDKSQFLGEEKDFKILEMAKAWDEKKKTPAPKNPSVLPGQISIEDDGLFDDVNADAVIKNPTSDFAEESAKYFDEQRTEPGDFREIEEPIMIPAPDSFYDDAEPKEGEVWQAGGIDTDDYDEEDEAYADMQADMETIEDDAEKSVENPTSDLAEDCVFKKYDSYTLVKGASPWVKPTFKKREDIRDFYNNYRDWEQLYTQIPFIEVYRYRFNKATIYAISNRQSDILTAPSDREYTFQVRYFWQNEDGFVFETRKIDLEKYIPEHKDELLGVAK